MIRVLSGTCGILAQTFSICAQIRSFASGVSLTASDNARKADTA
jgi:hypothetical protein